MLASASIFSCFDQNICDLTMDYRFRPAGLPRTWLVAHASLATIIRGLFAQNPNRENMPNCHVSTKSRPLADAFGVSGKSERLIFFEAVSHCQKGRDAP